MEDNERPTGTGEAYAAFLDRVRGVFHADTCPHDMTDITGHPAFRDTAASVDVALVTVAQQVGLSESVGDVVVSILADVVEHYGIILFAAGFAAGLDESERMSTELAIDWDRVPDFFAE